MSNKKEYECLLIKAINAAYNKGLNGKLFRLTSSNTPGRMIFQYAGDCFFVGLDMCGTIKRTHTIQENTYSLLNKIILKNICAYLEKGKFEVLQ